MPVSWKEDTMSLRQTGSTDDGIDKPLIVAGLTITADELRALAPLVTQTGDIQAKTKSIVLLSETGMARYAQTVGGNTALANYKVTVTVERDPISEDERVAVARKLDASNANKTAKTEAEKRSKDLLVESVKKETREQMEAGAVLARRIVEQAEAARKQAEAVLRSVAGVGQ